MPNDDRTRRHDRALGGQLARHPGIAIVTAALLFAAVAAVRRLDTGAVDAVAVLFCLPTAVLAMEFGLRGGVPGSALGAGLLVAWSLHAHADLTALGWTARLTPLLLCGLVLGRSADRWRRAEVERHRLAVRLREHRRVIESNDDLVQHLSAAKWTLEAGHADRALVIMGDAVELGHRLVSDLVREADLGAAWTGRGQSDRTTAER